MASTLRQCFLSAISTGLLVLVLGAIMINSFLRQIAGGDPSDGEAQPDGTGLSRSALGELDANADFRSPLAQPRREMAKTSMYRLRDNVQEVLGGVVEEWAQKTHLSQHDVGLTVAEILLKDKAFQGPVQAKVDKELKRKRGGGAVSDSMRPLWKHLSRPEIVATDFGWQSRRLILGSICGSDTSYPDAVSFLGGDLSQGTFHDAKIRRKEALGKENMPGLLIGERQQRSDRLEVLHPKALERIEESISFRTQPSPSASRTKHDFTPGNHTRSDLDNSLICVHPEKCSTEAIRFMMGTRTELFHSTMEDLGASHAQGDAEVARICQTAFDTLVPFYVVEQSLRCCLCVHCYRAKLITIALCELWPTFHQGATPGSACTCMCDLCKNGGCATFLPYDSPKAVDSMVVLSDLLLCDKVVLYVARDGTRIKTHRSACVSGQCIHCRARQERLYGCPKLQDADPSALNNGGPSEGRPGEVRWKNFTTVDGNGNATTTGAPSRRRQNQQGDVDDDGDYDPLGGASKNKQRKAVAEIRGTVADFVKDFSSIHNRFAKHRRQYKIQQTAFKECKVTLEPGHVVVVVDFQERLSIREQDEVQSQHWDHEATTIFPAPVFIKWSGRVWAYSFQVLSDDMAQDNAWVQHVMSKLLNDEIPALLRSIGADPMTRVTIFTDNCAKQFKCRFHFGWVADSGIMCLDNEGVATGEKVRVEHHYFGSCHGKNISDSEGGITKTYARDSVTNQTWTVASPRDLCDKLSKALNFMLRDPTDEQREGFEARRGGRGSEQLLVTKTWIGEGRSTEQEKTFLLTKKPNTILGRKYIFVGVEEVTTDVRNRARSSAKEISVSGCQAISRIASTDTPGVLATYTLSCFCPECLAHRPENCPLIRQGIMTGPTEFSRKIERDSEDSSDKHYALLDMFDLMQFELPFGSTALIRVDPSEYRGQDIVPVVIARKAPCQWSSDYSRDGMFTQEDTMVWVYDLSQAPEGGQVAEYLVPDELSTDQLRAVPLTSIAGLGQGLRGYMDRSVGPTLSGATKTFVLRNGVLEDARSTIVLMSTTPSSAFSDFQAEPLSDEDLTRAPVVQRMIPDGTVVKKGCKGPVMATGQRAWRGSKNLEGTVVSVVTDRKSRRHWYNLEWMVDANTHALAGVASKVDEGYVERFRKRVQ